MSNHTPFVPKIIPFNPESSLPEREQAARNVPPGLAEIDGAAIAALKPDDNTIEKLPVVRGKRAANDTELNLHSDGTLCKYMVREGFEPQQLLVDGSGRVFGVAGNEALADMICNGVNALHLAKVLQLKEDADRRAQQNPGGAPPALLLPPDYEGESK